MTQTTTPYLSLIIPAFNCPTIDRDLEKLTRFLSSLKITYEIICIVDGLSSSQDQTLRKAQALKLKHLKVISYSQNQGKGFAVRTGFQEARGQVVGFFDAGSDIATESIATALDILKDKNADIVVGSKLHSSSIVSQRPFWRRLLSTLNQIPTKVIFRLPVSDTQVGLKLFRRSVVKKILPLLAINGFAFDIELLSLAKRSGFHRIFESPVTVAYNRRSTVKLSSLFIFLLDYLKIIHENLSYSSRLQ